MEKILYTLEADSDDAFKKKFDPIKLKKGVDDNEKSAMSKTRLKQENDVALDGIERIRLALECGVDDILEFIPDEKEGIPDEKEGFTK